MGWEASQTSAAPSQPNAGAAQEDAVLEVKCACGLLVIKKTAKKEGPNFGRVYFTCEKGRKEFGGCDFFKWAPKAEGEASAASATSAKGIVMDQMCQCGVPVLRKIVT